MTDSFKIVKYAEQYRDAWDDFVQKSRNGTFLHTRPFIEYHGDRFEDRSILVMQGTSLVAVFPANKDGNTIVSHGGLTFGGLIYGFKQRAPDVHAAMTAIVDHYKTDGFSKIYYKTVPHIFHRYPADDDLHALFTANARLVRRDLSSVIFLPKRPKTSNSRKMGINKAKRSGLSIVEGKFFPEFHALLSNVLARHGAKPVHSIAEMSLLQSRFPDQIRLVGGFQGETLLAAAWLFEFENVVHTQYLAASEEGRKIGALDYLISNMIENSPPSTDKFSFGASTEDGGRTINEGLLFQKEGFGARSIALDHYELDILT